MTISGAAKVLIGERVTNAFQEFTQVDAPKPAALGGIHAEGRQMILESISVAAIQTARRQESTRAHQVDPSVAGEAGEVEGLESCVATMKRCLDEVRAYATASGS